MLALFAIATAAQAQFGGGTGASYAPYIISTTDHMTELANYVNGGTSFINKYFRLDADLDYSGKTYTVIGNRYRSFDAHFNGNGHTISGVRIDKSAAENASMYVGLFGGSYGGVIENLTLSNSTIKACMVVGGIVGVKMGGTIRNCHVTSDVTIEVVHMYYDGSNQPVGTVGGILGGTIEEYTHITDCTCAATLIAPSGSDEIGGIAGYIDFDGGTIESCAYTGTIDFGGTEYVGGIVGKINNSDNVTLANNYTGGNCTIGAVGVKGSSQGTDEGVGVQRIYTIDFITIQGVSGTIATQPMTISGTDYYAAGSTITLSNMNTTGSPGGGNIWIYRAMIYGSVSNGYAEAYPQEDGTWQFTMPNGNVLIYPRGVTDITLTGYPYNTKVTFIPANATYTGSALHPTAIVEARGTELTEGTDFFTDIPAAGFTNAGKYPVKIWGMGNYGGLRIDTFTVAKAPLTSLTLNETSVYHDGAAHKPTLTVKSGDKTLTEGTEYETDLPNEGFTDLGDHIIKVWGIGNYTDTLSATYTICHPWDGMGTELAPFLIQNTDDMDRLAAFVNGGNDYEGVYFRQVGTLDYTGKTYTPVGNRTTPFNGTFNGGTMTGISVSGQQYTGVFGNVGLQGTVRSVMLTGTNSFSGTDSHTGAIAGCNRGIIESCQVAEGANVTVTTTGSTAGGIVGINFGLVNSCINYAASVTAGWVGGIVGVNMDSGQIYGTNYATVTGSDYCGGIAGYNMGFVYGQHYGTIVCADASTIAGGIVGVNSVFGTVESCLSTDLMASLSGTNIGAIVGWNRDDAYGGYGNGTVKNSYYIGACKFGGIEGSDVFGQAMRGWPISCDEAINFDPLSDASGNFIGTYYDDGTNNHYYVGEGELLRFMLFGGTGYTANGTALAVVGHDDDYDVDYYELTMPAALVHIAPTGLMLTLYDNWVNNHNVEDIAEAHGKVRSVIIDGRTLYKTGNWNTLCLPFNLNNFEGTPLKDATVKTLTSSSYANGTLTLNFTTVSAIEAGKPYLVKWASGDNIENPVFSGVTICNTLAPTVTDCVDFIGSYDIEYLTGQDRSVLYLGGDNKLYYPINDMKVNAFRGHFQLKNGLTAGDLPSNAKNFVLNFGDSTTEIGASLNDNGQWINDNFYSIDGRKLQGEPKQKGVYIVNGKKIIK